MASVTLSLILEKVSACRAIGTALEGCDHLGVALTRSFFPPCTQVASRDKDFR